MNNINNLENYFESSKINGNSRGSSDITLQHKHNNSWIFISSKISFDNNIEPITDCSASMLFGSSLRLFCTKLKALIMRVF